MTAPNIPLFQRKQSPMQQSSDATQTSNSPENQTDPARDTAEPATVQCPQCGCEFDPDQQEGEDGGGGTSPEQLAQMLGLSGGGQMQGGPPMGGM